MYLRTFILFYALSGASGLVGQVWVGAEFLGSRTRLQVAKQFNQPLVAYDVQCYRLLYTTRNTAGQMDTVSGLVAVPFDPERTFPRLLYQHGTASSKTDVPSFNVFSGGEGEWALLFAGIGFAVLAPDYLGLGVAKGFHPYVHAASESWVAADMLRAFAAFAQQHDVHTHEQLFVTGYSQGGHAAMAFHRDAETLWSHEFAVTAAAHLSGPYSTGEVMRDLVLSDKVYLYPAYIPNTLIGYQGVYGNLYTSFQEVFRDQYIGNISDFQSGKITLVELQVRLVAQLIFYELACKLRRLFRDSYLQGVITQVNHPLNVALRDNNVYDWAPKAPTRIYYCGDDDQVPPQNSLLAYQTMLGRGATQVRAQDVKPNANHSQCAAPAIDSTLAFFLTYRLIGSVSGQHEEVGPLSLSVQPNPTSGLLWVRQVPARSRIEVFDMGGRLRYEGQVEEEGDFRLDLQAVESGFYLLRVKAGERCGQQKVVIWR